MTTTMTTKVRMDNEHPFNILSMRRLPLAKPIGKQVTVKVREVKPFHRSSRVFPLEHRFHNNISTKSNDAHHEPNQAPHQHADHPIDFHRHHKTSTRWISPSIPESKPVRSPQVPTARRSTAMLHRCHPRPPPFRSRCPPIGSIRKSICHARAALLHARLVRPREATLTRPAAAQHRSIGLRPSPVNVNGNAVHHVPLLNTIISFRTTRPQLWRRAVRSIRTFHLAWICFSPTRNAWNEILRNKCDD